MNGAIPTNHCQSTTIAVSILAAFCCRHELNLRSQGILNSVAEYHLQSPIDRRSINKESACKTDAVREGSLITLSSSRVAIAHNATAPPMPAAATTPVQVDC